jgi:triosephosphate isomerase
MFKTVSEARQLVTELMPGLAAVTGVEKVLCPPFTSLLAVKALLEGSQVGLGAQDMFWEPEGAYTGEIAPPMVAELCQYVILGHSERRTYFGETDATVNKKVKAAFAHGLIPIVCVGETLEENETGKTAEVVSRQVKGGLQDLELADPRRLVIAYEPVWAIGTGKAATAQLANSIIGDVVRGALSDIYGRQNAEQVRILYGGSVKGSIAAEFFHQPEIDGALVGGASLKPADFLQIVLAAA